MDNHHSLFFQLLRAGLWEKPVKVSQFLPMDLDTIYSLAREQTVMGLITSGLGHVEDVAISKNETRRFIIDVGGIVARNNQMNDFIASLMATLNNEGIKAVLVKGQGVAQFYERPLWRSCGDVDLLLDAANFEKAKACLVPRAHNVEEELSDRKHIAMRIDSFEVELHGTMSSMTNPSVDDYLSKTIENMFLKRELADWNCNGVPMLLPSPDNNILIVFTHILQHFFNGGLGFRQVCDWCRVLWKTKEGIDLLFLKNSLEEMRVMTEWKAFGCVAVDYLGMPLEAMPFYDPSFHNKADRVVRNIMTVGNFGHNRDNSYQRKYSRLLRKLISFWRMLSDTIVHFRIFPLDALRYFRYKFAISSKAVMRGE